MNTMCKTDKKDVERGRSVWLRRQGRMSRGLCNARFVLTTCWWLAGVLLAAPGQAGGSLTKAELLELCEKGVATSVIVRLVEANCVDFEIDTGVTIDLSNSVPPEVIEAAILCRQGTLGPKQGATFLRVDDLAPPTSSVARPCPLQLELDIAPVRDLEATKRSFWDSRRTRGYYCEDATISYIKAQKEADVHGQVRLIWVFSVRVQPSFDRVAELAVELRNGPEMVASMKKPWFEVEEGQTKQVRVVFLLTASRYNRLFHQDPALPNMRVELAIRED